MLAAFWEYYDRDTIEQQILPLLFEALKSPDPLLRDISAMALVDYQPPVNQAIRVLSETSQKNPRSDSVIKSLNHFKRLAK